MDWNNLLSAKRFGLEDRRIANQDDARSQFQRDYDRIIFSSPFRRMQNKTQVFPLPGSVLVHNRLTHSLEVASVGRSLGMLLTQYLRKNNLHEENPLVHEIGSSVSAACLAHDLGNPPFGHAGEEAISRYFKEGAGKKYKTSVSPEVWQDLIHFEGNANAFRLLTNQFKGRRKGGFALTYTTLAAIVKYPWGSDSIPEGKRKYGYFNSEKKHYANLTDNLSLMKKGKENDFYRHPLVYLVEAADDICYEIMDIEDAHKLNILSTEETTELLINYFNPVNDQYFFKRYDEIHKSVLDTNERIAYLRASVINKLVNTCIDIFIEHEEDILKGSFEGSLIKNLQGQMKTAFELCKTLAIDKIYSHQSVVEIELSGFNILEFLLDQFINAVFQPQDKYSKKLISLIPAQYDIEEGGFDKKIRSVVDYVSGMTDLYAVDLFKSIRGIKL